MIQGTRPRTAAVGLNDSPAGLAAWIVEKFQEWSDCGDDVESRYSKDELLTNVMLYWATGTIGSSFLPYHDVINAGAIRWMREKAKDWMGSSTGTGRVCALPQRYIQSAARVGRTLLQRAALDRDAEGRTLRRP